jgi:hypothetical protein
MAPIAKALGNSDSLRQRRLKLADVENGSQPVAAQHDQRKPHLKGKGTGPGTRDPTSAPAREPPHAADQLDVFFHPQSGK